MNIEIDLPTIPKKGKIKIIKLKTGEFLYKLYDDRMETTNHIKRAMDVSDLDINTIMEIMGTLTRHGYKPEILERYNK
ncbi:hypothetical protein [Bacillus mojavensis]